MHISAFTGNTHRTTHKETEKTDSNSFCLQVKPVIKLLKQTLVGTGALLVSAVMLFIFATPAEDFIQNTFGTPIPASKNRKFNLRYLKPRIKSPKLQLTSTNVTFFNFSI